MWNDVKFVHCDICIWLAVCLAVLYSIIMQTCVFIVEWLWISCTDNICDLLLDDGDEIERLTLHWLSADDSVKVLNAVNVTGLQQFVVISAADNEPSRVCCIPWVYDNNGRSSQTVGQTAASCAPAVFTTDQSDGVM